jgi:hypothetical protein
VSGAELFPILPSAGEIPIAKYVFGPFSMVSGLSLAKMIY